MSDDLERHKQAQHVYYPNIMPRTHGGALTAASGRARSNQQVKHVESLKAKLRQAVDGSNSASG